MRERPAFESRLNILLSELLTEYGIFSRSEQSSFRARKDVVVSFQGLTCVLEGSYSKSDAEQDAKKRLEQLSADIAIAIHYDPRAFPQTLSEIEIKKKLRESLRLHLKILVPEHVRETLGPLSDKLLEKKIISKPVTDWQVVDFQGLRFILTELGEFLLSEESIKDIEERITSLIEEFVGALVNHPQSEKIAHNLYEVLFQLYGFSIGNPTTIKEAIFAQSILAILLSAIYYETVCYAHSLEPLHKQDFNPQRVISLAFEKILKIDYKEIFKISQKMIDLLPPLPRLFEKLRDTASEIASKKALLRKDLAGRIYHKVVGEWSLKKGLATYYTETPSAYLLAYLGKPSLFPSSKICDFACGSGTLLSAAYSAASQAYRFSLLNKEIEKSPSEIDKEFHEKFIKQTYGFDVLSYATQITAINLALHNPETPLEGFNIFTIPLGVKGDSVSLGSLEFIVKTSDLYTISQQVGLDSKEEKLLQDITAVKKKSFDFIIMNPPFTRATGRGGKEGGGLFGFMLEPSERKNILSRYKQLRKNIREELIREAKELLKNTKLHFLLKDYNNVYTNIGQAGEGLLFMVLAHKMLKEKGKMSFVLPKNFLSGTTWFLGRALMLKNYHIETIVISYDSENGYNFSESTSLSECLFVAQKDKPNEGNSSTKFVLLLRKPKTSLEAVALTKKIEDSSEGYIELRKNGAAALIINKTRRELLENIDNWGKLVFIPSPKLLEMTEALLQRNTLELGSRRSSLQMIELGKIAESIGIDRHQFLDNFEFILNEIPGSRKAIRGGDESLRKKMLITPNGNILMKNGSKSEALYKAKSGRLLLPDRLRINTSHTIAMLSTQPVLANMFYVAKLKRETEKKLKALCLWLNTTWGLLTILANKQETEGPWINLKKSKWELMPILNVESLSNKTLDELEIVFERFKYVDLGRLPQQYMPGSSQLRLDLDKSVLLTLGINIEETELLALYEEIYRAITQWLGKQ